MAIPSSFQRYILIPLLIWIKVCHSFQTLPVKTRLSIKNRSKELITKFKLNAHGHNHDDSEEPETVESWPRSKRRDFLISSSAIILQIINFPNQASGIVTDETSSFANTKSDSAYSPVNLGTSSTLTGDNTVTSSTPIETQAKQSTDEIKFSIPISKIKASGLGIELADVEFRTNRRVYVKSIMPSSLAAQLGVQTNWVLVSINDQSTERTNAKGVKQIISDIMKSSFNSNDNLQLVFRDNSFQNQLQSLTPNKEAVTQVAPAGDTTQRKEDGSIRVGSVTSQDDQKMIVSQLVPPRMCKRGATTDDLLEISYVGKVVETGDIFDGSAIMVNGKGVPGR